MSACRIKWCCAVREKAEDLFCKIHQPKINREYVPSKLSMNPPDDMKEIKAL